MNWELKRFSEIVTISKGEAITKASENEGSFPVILGGQEPAYYIDRYNHDGEAIVISRSGASAGYASFWNEPIFITDGYLVEPTAGNHRKYIYYLLKHFGKALRDLQNGAAIPHVTPKTIYNLKAPIPPLCVQERIAGVLSAYDNLIEINNKRIKLLEQMAENLYKEWFVRFRFPSHKTADFENGIPKGWRISTLGKEASFINGRAYLMPELQETGKYRIVRVGNFSGKDEWFFSDMELEKDKYCERGDLLYKWSCNFGPEIWNEEKAIYHYHIWKVLPGENMTKAFLFHYLSNSTRLWLGGTNGTAMAHITKESIEKKKIVVPSPEILQAFESYAQLIMDQVLSLKKQSENLIKQRDLLLPRLMSGKLEV